MFILGLVREINRTCCRVQKQVASKNEQLMKLQIVYWLNGLHLFFFSLPYEMKLLIFWSSQILNSDKQKLFYFPSWSYGDGTQQGDITLWIAPNSGAIDILPKFLMLKILWGSVRDG